MLHFLLLHVNGMPRTALSFSKLISVLRCHSIKRERERERERERKCTCVHAFFADVVSLLFAMLTFYLFLFFCRFLLFFASFGFIISSVQLLAIGHLSLNTTVGQTALSKAATMCNKPAYCFFIFFFFLIFAFIVTGPFANAHVHVGDNFVRFRLWMCLQLMSFRIRQSIEARRWHALVVYITGPGHSATFYCYVSCTLSSPTMLYMY